jgi:hypothetical protein
MGAHRPKDGFFPRPGPMEKLQELFEVLGGKKAGESGDQA